ncbi:MAG: c-type cytochrome, partial [Verrucomicrobiota bacterium]|nr:c-type cytochrome [Verrucomicrobiota bacterium]
SNPKYRSVKVKMMSGFLDALNAQGQTLTTFHNQANEPLKKAIKETDVLFTYARTRLSDPLTIPLLTRGLSHHEADRLKLIGLLNAKEPPAIQKIALTTLSKGQHPKLTAQLLKDWSSYGPGTRVGVIDTLLTRESWTQELLVAVEKGNLAITQISPAHRQKLGQHPKLTIRSKANQLFGQIDPNRAKIIARYQEVTKLQGDAKRGAELFKVNCAVCHKFRNEGNPVGPDLATLAGKPTADWLIALLDPNRAVEDKYIGYVVTTRSQAVHTGVITVETPTSLTLRTLTGQEQVILRSNIKSLQSTGLSLMPSGLEAVLPPQAIADLLTYIREK